VLTHRFSWKRLSMSGVLAYRPDRSEAVFVFGIKHGAYNTASLIEFLTICAITSTASRPP
jgi:hypothetical protein